MKAGAVIRPRSIAMPNRLPPIPIAPSALGSLNSVSYRRSASENENVSQSGPKSPRYIASLQAAQDERGDSIWEVGGDGTGEHRAPRVAPYHCSFDPRSIDDRDD